MRCVILRDDDTSALTPADCLERLYRPFHDRGLPVNLAVIPHVRTDVTMPDGRPEGFLVGKRGGLPPALTIGSNREPTAVFTSFSMVIIMIILSLIGAIAPKSSAGWTKALDCCPRLVFLRRKLSSRLTTNFHASACKRWPDVSPCFRPDGLSCDVCRSRGGRATRSRKC